MVVAVVGWVVVVLVTGGDEMKNDATNVILATQDRKNHRNELIVLRALLFGLDGGFGFIRGYRVGCVKHEMTTRPAPRHNKKSVAMILHPQR